MAVKMHKSQPKGKSLIPGGKYSAEAHGGAGKSQKLMWPAAGTGMNKPTPNANKLGGQRGYDKGHDGGVGRGQNIGMKATGTKPRSKTPNSRPMGHVDDSRTISYQTSAHTDTHHGKKGQAAGVIGDHKYPNYPTGIFSEGRKHLDPAPGSFVSKMHEGREGSASGKAQHHPRMGEAHEFKGSPAVGAHGFGHPVSVRKGALRMSGHANAHRIGAK